MVKVIIVEDDFYIRDYLKNSIEWEKNGFAVVGEAPDGVKAFKVIESENPDIVITDIVMPNMNGVDLIKKIKDEGINSKVVVLSSYDDFEYVKESMKLGAEEYILKHSINPEEIIGLMKNICEKMKAENKSKEEIRKAIHAYKSSFDRMKAAFTGKLLAGKLTNENDIEKMLSSLDLKIHTGYVAVAVLEVEDCDKSPVYKKDDKHALFQYAAMNILNELLEQKGIGISYSYDEETYAVVLGIENLGNMSEVEMHIAGISMKIAECFKKYLEVNVTMGISNFRKGIKEAYNCYNEAKYALQYKIFKGRGKRIYYRDVRPTFESVETKEMLVAFSVNLNLKNYMKCKELLQMCKDEISLKYISFEKYIDTFKDILTQTARHLSKNNIDFEDIFMEDSIPYEKIEQFETPDELIKWLVGMLDEISEINMEEQISCRNEVKKVIEYINKNYSKSITLNEAAEYAQISYAYLSQLFKQQTGKSFVDYLNEVRIKNAKNLLNESAMKVYEVAFNVGFKDPNYFIRVFKNITGMTPNEYKLIG